VSVLFPPTSKHQVTPLYRTSFWNSSMKWIRKGHISLSAYLLHISLSPTKEITKTIYHFMGLRQPKNNKTPECKCRSCTFCFQTFVTNSVKNSHFHHFQNIISLTFEEIHIHNLQEIMKLSVLTITSLINYRCNSFFKVQNFQI